MPQNKYNSRPGFSILLAILIMSSLTIMTIAMSDIVLRVGRTSKKIGQSEIAYYAAETAVEKALYYIEKSEPRTIIIPGGGSGNLVNITDASWTRIVSEDTDLTIECGEGEGQLHSDEEGVCVDSAGDITASNPLQVQLNPGSSFQLDLDFQGLSLPNNLPISWSGTGKLIALGNVNGQNIYSSSETLHNLDTERYIIRLVNEGSVLLTFQLTPAGGNLPIGILVIGTGIYQDQERVLEVERSNWQIY